MSDTQISGLTAVAAAAAIEAGALSPAELFEAYRARAATDALNCFTWVADRVPNDPDPRAPLRGVPLAVKDLFCTEGVPSQSGSRILEGYRPPYTATAVARLAQAGAPLLAKTNQDEFAMGSSNENSAYGPVLNPWDRGRVPGGSSGGSAAAVAAGLSPWALGTDTGGSIRQPAALCGIVGLKPTYGAVSRYGMIAFASSLDQAGPLTRDVTRRGAAAAPHGRPRRARRDLAGVPAGDRATDRREPEGRAAGRARRARRRGDRGDRTGRPRGLPRDPRPRARPRSDRPDRRRAAARAVRPRGLLRDRPRGVLVEPGAFRRGALRPARRGRGGPAGHVHAHPPRRFRAGGQAADHARHLRAVLGLLRRVLRPCAAGAHEDRAGLPRGLRGGRLRSSPRPPPKSRSPSARRAATRGRCT